MTGRSLIPVLMALAGSACAVRGHVRGPDPEADFSREEIHALWPVYHRVTQDGARRITVLPLFFDRLLTDEEGRRDHDWAVFPILLAGSDPEHGDHLLVFPVWGNLKELLGKDELRVRLFPLYLDAVEDDYRSWHVLWPLISGGKGEDRWDFRFLPFYSRRVKEGHGHSTAVLWPLVTWGEEDLNTGHPSSSIFVFPFYGRRDSDVAWSRTYLFPFFTFAGTVDGFSDVNLLWPVYRRMESPSGHRALRVWPLFSHDRRGEFRDDWYLWPIVWDRHLVMPEGELRSFHIAPIFREIEYLDLEGDRRRRVTQVWPLWRAEEAADGTGRFSLLAPIPFADWEAFERIFGPLWTVLEVERGRERGEFRILSGLFGVEVAEGERALRLLWLLRIPF